MTSLLSTDGWPFSITGRLTNCQPVDARLRMMRHFAFLVKSCGPELTVLPKPARTRLKLDSGAWSIPRPGKANRQGEDSYFIEGSKQMICFKDDMQASDVRISFAGVADGVGEWSEYGCSPRAFADALMIGAQRAASTMRYHWSQSKNPEGFGSGNDLANGPPGMRVSQANNVVYSRAGHRALHIMREGFGYALSQESCFGSATALIAGMDEKGDKLGVANIGDSSLIVLRRASSNPLSRSMTIIRRTKEQQHFFNCPYQLSRIPTKEEMPILEARGMTALVGVLARTRGSVQTDTPDMAALYDIDVQEGDLILIGSDGLFDNLFDVEIVQLASLCLSPYDACCANYLLKNTTNNVPSQGPLKSQADMFDREYSATTPDVVKDPLQHKDLKLLTDSWINNKFPHPRVIPPPVQTSRYGIATPPQLLARAIAEAAFYRSLEPRAKTPFARQARQAGCHMMAQGGKLDDITVVAAWVSSEHN